jgi:hypothetical protein
MVTMGLSNPNPQFIKAHLITLSLDNFKMIEARVGQMITVFCLESVRGEDHSEELGIDGRCF